jgi:hypothetical protein
LEVNDLRVVGSAVRLRLAAGLAGWSRELGTRREPGVRNPLITWRHSDGREFPSGCPELQPEPVRSSVRGVLRSWFEERCPACGVLEVELDDDELRAADMTLLQLSPLTAGRTGITHLGDCPLRPIAQASRLVNAHGARSWSAGAN